ncbi:hypothetical protein AcV5_008618 [Taiwanofungus camphoratus]|nr:hypothetical protein AcV5_008618 [Antrodia cinnamomea]KAI0956117.1 hypothetical protein AcV7_006608 [Antrodia cinnamomea]
MKLAIQKCFTYGRYVRCFQTLGYHSYQSDHVILIVPRNDTRPLPYMYKDPDVESAIALINKGLSRVVPPDTAEPAKRCPLLKSSPEYRKSLIIPSKELEKVHTDLPTMGLIATVWMGHFRGQAVALKVVRPEFEFSGPGFQEFAKDFIEGCTVWNRLRHPNIVSLLGVNTSLFTDNLCVVTPWMGNSDIEEYLRLCPQADRLNLVIDVAAGLEYLHSMGVIHGDLKGRNILVDDDGTARITDIGINVLHQPFYSGERKEDLDKPYRWTAPEVLDPEWFGAENLPPNQTVDIYSFAMVMIETFTGRMPWSEYDREARVCDAIWERRGPQRPSETSAPGLSGDIWNILFSVLRQLREIRASSKYPHAEDDS